MKYYQVISMKVCVNCKELKNILTTSKMLLNCCSLGVALPHLALIGLEKYIARGTEGLMWQGVNSCFQCARTWSAKTTALFIGQIHWALNWWTGARCLSGDRSIRVTPDAFCCFWSGRLLQMSTKIFVQS